MEYCRYSTGKEADMTKDVEQQPPIAKELLQYQLHKSAYKSCLQITTARNLLKFGDSFNFQLSSETVRKTQAELLVLYTKVLTINRCGWLYPRGG